MTEKIAELQKEIEYLPSRENLVSVLVYGTMITESDFANDLDIVIVVNQVNTSLNALINILTKYSQNLDFNVYTHKELVNNLSYFTREFKLEYLAKGVCIYGSNIFEQEFKKVDNFKYRQSILIRSIEHMQMMRQKYFSPSFSPEQKFNYLKKYFLRISKNILLFKGVDSHTSVNKLSDGDVMKKLYNLGMFSSVPNLENIVDADEYCGLFDLISDALIRCKKEFDAQVDTMQIFPAKK